VFVAAVFMSNIPEAMSASAGLSKQGRTTRSIFLLWGSSPPRRRWRLSPATP
jgi:hypothetical protein